MLGLSQIGENVYFIIRIYMQCSKIHKRGYFYVSSANLKYYTRNFQYEATRLWNNISGSIQQSTMIPVFKSRYMKKYFTQ